MSEKRTYKFNAFISYRHVEPDFAIAKRLHTLIEQFTVPKDLDVAQHSDFRVFRDREELPTGELGTAINAALADSEYLIVICSPRTPDSPWCRREITEFRKTHDDSKIIAVLVEGRPETSFPPELQNLSTQVVATDCEKTDVLLELLAADVRTEAAREPNFEGYAHIEHNDKARLAKETKEAFAILKKTEHQRIMATILGVTLGDLVQRQKERRVRRLLTFGSIVGIILTGVVIAMTTLFINAQRAEREAQDKSAQLQLDSAFVALERGDRALALAMGQDAVNNLDSSMDGYAASRSAYHGLLLEGIDYPALSGVAHMETGAMAPFFSQDPTGDRIVTGGPGNTAIVWETKSGQPLTEIETASPVVRAHFYGDDKITAVMPQAVEVFDATSGLSVARIDLPVARVQVSGTLMEGRYLIVVPEDYSYMVIDLDTNEVIHEDDRAGSVGRMAVSGHSPLLASVNDDFTTTVIDLSTGEEVALLPAFEGDNSVNEMMPIFSGDGSTLVLAKTQIGVAWYSTETWELEEIEEDIFFFLDNATMRLTHDGNTLAIINYNGESPMMIDKPGTGRNTDGTSSLNSYYYLSDDTISSDLVDAAISDDGNWMVSAHADGSINVIAVDGTAISTELIGRLGATSEDRRWVVASSSWDMWLHEVHDDGTISSHEMPRIDFTTAVGREQARYGNAVTNDGEWAYVVSGDGSRIALRSTSNMDRQWEAIIPPQVVDTSRSVATNPVFDANNTLYLPGNDGVVRSRTFEGEWGREYAIGSGTVADLVIDSAERVIAASLDNGSFVIFNYETGETVVEGSGQIIAMDTVGDTFEALGIDSGAFFTVRDGDIATGAEIATSFKRDTNGITVATASADHRYIVAEAGGSNPVLIDVETGTEIKRDDFIPPMEMNVKFVGQSYTYLHNYANSSSWDDHPLTHGVKIEALSDLEDRLDDIAGEREINAVQIGN